MPLSRFARVSFGFFLLLAWVHGVFAQSRSLPDFSELVEREGAAVVNISTTQLSRANVASAFPFDEQDPAFELFRRFMPRLPGGGGSREFENKSLGSGFLISPDGYILTNAHVVEGADGITVRLVDKREFKAKLVGADKRTDVAVIKIDATALPVVKLADPARLRVGEWVVAIGSPFGFDHSVTAGIVSAKGRALPQENYVPFIQTDVAINPGNSGGPLFNMRGEVVGINSQIYSRSGGYMGVSFAIPIDVAMDIQQQLRQSGRVSRGRLGVVIQEVNKEIAESLGVGRVAGALVSSVEPSGPADKAGIKAGDVILKFEGKPIQSSADLPRQVAATKPGARAQVQLWRAGALMDLVVLVGELQEDRQAANRGRDKKPMDVAANRLGVLVSELSADRRRALGVSGGLLVEEIRSSGKSELRVGDVLLAVLARGVAHELKTPAQLSQVLANVPAGAAMTFLVRRGDVQTFMTIRLPESQEK